jgi:protease-4
MTEPTVPDWERAVLEKVALQALEEQRRARQWKALFRLLWFTLAFLLVAAWLGWIGRPDKDLDTSVVGVGKHTALVELEGVIGPESKASSERMIKALNRAFKDRNTQGVVVRINSPGGSPVQAGYINDEIRRLRAKYPNTPVMPWSRTCAPRAAITWRSPPTASTWTRRASWVPSARSSAASASWARSRSSASSGAPYTAGDNKDFLDPFAPEKPEHRSTRRRCSRNPPAIHPHGEAGPRQPPQGNAGDLLRAHLDRREERRARVSPTASAAPNTSRARW